MCKPIAIALWAAMLLPTASRAQEAALRQQLDVFARAARAASARLRAFDDSVARQRDAYQRVEAGPFRLLVEPRLATVVAEAASRTSDSLSWLGGALDRVRQRTFVVRRVAERATNLEAAIVDSGGVEYSPVVGLRARDDVEAATLLLGTIARNVLEEDLFALHRGWFLVRVPLDTVRASEWTRLRLDLVSSLTTVGPRCYQGDLAACSALLGLTPTGDPIIDWYDAEGRRQVITRRWAPYLGRALRGMDAECAEGSDTACIAAMRASFSGWSTELTRHRGTLLRLALQMGGPGAAERLYVPAASPAERIAIVAGAPADSVVRMWHSRVRDTRLPSDDLTPSIAVMSLLWVGLFGALALRSPRWR